MRKGDSTSKRKQPQNLDSIRIDQCLVLLSGCTAATGQMPKDIISRMKMNNFSYY